MPVPADPHQDAPSRSYFDVEQFRPLRRRHAVVRQLARPTLVLGSTQRHGIVSGPRARELDIEVVHRRGGGGAVLLQPGNHLWIDAWIPRHDPFWDGDVAAAALWVGDWWCAALGSFGVDDCVVHRGGAVPGRHGALVCFAGRGPGEVLRGDRKVMGLSQWRSREGALFHACTYSHWEPGPLVELLEVDPASREALRRDLDLSAVGLGDLDPPGPEIAELGAALLASFPTWGGN